MGENSSRSLGELNKLSKFPFVRSFVIHPDHTIPTSPPYGILSTSSSFLGSFSAAFIFYSLTMPLNAQGDLIVPSPDDYKHSSFSPHDALCPSPFSQSGFVYPSMYNEPAPKEPLPTTPLTKYEKKIEKVAQKDLKKAEKYERKRQRVENNMIAQLPANMAIFALPLIAGQDLLLLTSNHMHSGRLRAKVSHYTTLNKS